MSTLSAKKKLDFVIVGAQKSGTTALAAYLRDHRDIYVFGDSESKRSTHFFSDDRNFTSGQPDYAAYHRMFTAAQEQQLIGESTPNYMYWRSAPTRLWQYNADIKIIAVLRNPIERAYSHWNMERSRGAETLPFFEALVCERQRCRVANPKQHLVYSYVDRGYYSAQIREIWRLFPRENTLFLKSEVLRNNPSAALGQVCAFLGAAPVTSVAQKTVHEKAYPTAMTVEEREFLRDAFEAEIRSLEHMLGWCCSDWLSN